VSFVLVSLVEAFNESSFDSRNPWAHYSWKGDWSDDSELWTEELRDTLKPHGAPEGVFWISFEDVLK